MTRGHNNSARSDTPDSRVGCYLNSLRIVERWEDTTLYTIKLQKVNVACRSLACCPTRAHVVNQWPENLLRNKICCLRETPGENSKMWIPDWELWKTAGAVRNSSSGVGTRDATHVIVLDICMTHYRRLEPVSFTTNTRPYKCHTLHRCQEAPESPPLHHVLFYLTYVWFVGFEFPTVVAMNPALFWDGTQYRDTERAS